MAERVWPRWRACHTRLRGIAVIGASSVGQRSAPAAMRASRQATDRLRRWRLAASFGVSRNAEALCDAVDVEAFLPATHR